MADDFDDDRLVTVCASCLTASCWNYEFVCQEYRTANIKRMTVRELRALDREHPDNWKPREGGSDAQP